METEHIEACDNCSKQTNPSPSCIRSHDEVNLEVPLRMAKPSAQMVVDPILGSAKEVESNCICIISSFSNSDHQIQDEISIGDKITKNELQPSLESLGGTEGLYVDTKSARIPVSDSSEEEQFLFSDLDEFKLRESQCETKFSNGENKDYPSFCSEGNKEVNELFNTNDESYSPPIPDKFAQDKPLGDFENLIENSMITSHPIVIPKVHSVVGAEVGRVVESLPSISHIDDLDADDLRPLSHSLDSNPLPLGWTLHSKDESCCRNLNADKENQSVLEHSNNGDTDNSEDQNQSALEHSNNRDTNNSEDLKNAVASPAVGKRTWICTSIPFVL